MCQVVVQLKPINAVRNREYLWNGTFRSIPCEWYSVTTGFCPQIENLFKACAVCQRKRYKLLGRCGVNKMRVALPWRKDLEEANYFLCNSALCSEALLFVHSCFGC